jgi:SAM-dependent methyltransferase
MRWFWPTLTAAVVADALNLRSRVEALPVLAPAAPAPADGGGGGGEGGEVAPGHRFVTAAGVTVDDATARAACAHARAHGLDVVDLVPADLPAERLLAVVRFIDPATFRANAIANGVGALQAMLVSADVAERARVERFEGLSPAEMADLFAHLKRYAPRSTDLALAPTLRTSASAADRPVDDMAAVLNTAAVLGGQVGDLALLLGAARSRRPWALAAAAARVAQPLIATAGTRATPRDMPGAVPRQLVSSALGLPRTLARRRSAGEADALEAARADYAKLMAGGIERFFEPRRPDCPLCESVDLVVKVEAGDLVQCKPGTFVLEECRACGHVFQNPCLTPEGLDFYYRDFYDGAGDHLIEGAFNLIPSFYTARAEVVKGAGNPRRWLDVGGGHGHFCLAAKAVWPDTTFDGLDMSESIEEAERRGWVAAGHRGMFPELAAGLAGRYDAVSMFHYIEHTRDPGAELDAAATVLGPDGLLLIEVPDPESRVATVMGRFWSPWAQPQHLHFLTVGNLTKMLAARGFTPVTVRRAEAHIPVDFVSGATEFVNWLHPRVNVPWRPTPTVADRARRLAALAAGAPLVAAGLLADVALLPVGGRFRTSNSYRLLAVRTSAGGRATTTLRG